MCSVRFGCSAILFVLLAYSATAQPALTVDLVGGGAPVLVDGGLVWTIGVDPDEALFDTPDSGDNAGVNGASTALDIGFDLSGGNLAVAASRNSSNFDTNLPGLSTFGDETPDGEGAFIGVQIGDDPSNVFASLGSVYFTDGGSGVFEALTIQTAPLSLSIPGVTNTVSITWGGAYDANGLPGSTHGALAQGGSFDDQIGVAGSATYTATPGDADLTGGVDLDDLNTVLFNFLSGTSWEEGNFDGNATTDLDDLNSVLFNFLEPSGVLTFGGAAAGPAFTVGIVAPGLEGDFNGDGLVGLADVSIWRDFLGGVEDFLQGGGDASGTVDAGDFAIWKANFGATVAVVGLKTLIPEPATWILGVGASVAMALATRRREHWRRGAGI